MRLQRIGWQYAMTSVGMILNQRSNRSASVVDDLLHVAQTFDPIYIDVLDGIVGLEDALIKMNAKKVDIVILAGGDGTLQAALTDAINNNRFDHLPKFVGLPCGMTNVIANDCGLSGDPVVLLDQFFTRLKSGDTEIKPRSLLSVTAGSREPIHGFFLGAGAFHSAVQFSRSKVQSKGAKRSMALVTSVVSYTLKVAFDTDNTVEQVEMTFMNGGAPGIDIDGMQTLFMATTLKKLGSGLYPFWGEGAGGISVMAVGHPAKRIIRAAPRIARGKSRPWFQEYGYHSWCTDKIITRFGGPFVFDGEIFEADASEATVLEIPHKLEFLV